MREVARSKRDGGSILLEVSICQWQAVHFVSRAYTVLLKPLIKLLAPLGKTLGIVPLQSNS